MMPGFSIDVPHSLGKEGARKRLESFLETIEQKFKKQISEVSGGWEENVLTFGFTSFGIKITGKMTVEEENVKLDGEIPFAAMMFKGKISSEIKQGLEKALAS